MAKGGKDKGRRRRKRGQARQAKGAPPRDAFALLKRDHREVKALFGAFDKARSEGKKRSIAERALLALRVHSAIEEEVFYPALRAVLKKGRLLEQAQEEHRVAKTLVEDLAGDEADNFVAKFAVLASGMRRHMREEEGELFAQARKRKLDFEALGQRMLARKQELLADGRALEQAERSSQVKPYQRSPEHP